MSKVSQPNNEQIANSDTLHEKPGSLPSKPSLPGPLPSRPSSQTSAVQGHRVQTKSKEEWRREVRQAIQKGEDPSNHPNHPSCGMTCQEVEPSDEPSSQVSAVQSHHEFRKNKGFVFLKDSEFAEKTVDELKGVDMFGKTLYVGRTTTTQTQQPTEKMQSTTNMTNPNNFKENTGIVINDLDHYRPNEGQAELGVPHSEIQVKID